MGEWKLTMSRFVQQPDGKCRQLGTGTDWSILGIVRIGATIRAVKEKNGRDFEAGKNWMGKRAD